MMMILIRELGSRYDLRLHLVQRSFCCNEVMRIYLDWSLKSVCRLICAMLDCQPNKLI